MSKIPSFNIKSKLRLPSGFRGHQKSSESEKKQEEGQLVNSREKTLRASASPEDTESKENADDVLYDIDGPKSKSDCNNIEKTSQNLSKLAEKLNTLNAKESEPASKLPQRPAFRKRTSSNSTKVSVGQAKDKSSGISTHGHSPYGKASHLTTKPPLGKPKSYGLMKTGIETKNSRASGIPSSAAIQIRQSAKQVSQENEKNRKMGSDDVTQKEQIVSKQNETLQIEAVNKSSNETSKQSTASKTGVKKSSIPSGLDRFGARLSIGSAVTSKSSQNNRPGSTEFEQIKPRASSLVKRGSNECLAEAPEDNSKSPSGSNAVEKRGSKLEIKRRNSKENLRKDQQANTQRRQSGISSTQIKAPSQLKAPSKELQTMAVKLRSYGGKRSQRPLSYSAGKTSDPVVYRRRSGIPESSKISNSSSMQNLSSRRSPERRISENIGDSSTTKPLIKARSSSSLPSENGKSSESNLQVLKNGVVVSNSMKAPSYKPPLGKAIPRSMQRSKTTSSSSSEFTTLSFQREPYQSTPLRSVSDDYADDRFARPFVDDAYDEISGVFDDDAHGNANKTFNNVVKKSQLPLMNTTFEAPAAIQTVNSTQHNPIPNDINNKSQDENNITFDKDAINKITYPLNETINVLNKTQVIDTKEHAGIDAKEHAGIDAEEHAGIDAEKHSGSDEYSEISSKGNISNTPNESIRNNLPFGNQTIILDKNTTFSNETINIDKNEIKNIENNSNDNNIGDYSLSKQSRQGNIDRYSGVADLVTDNARAYSSAEFLENEAMLQLDDSFPNKLIDESLHLTPPAIASEKKTHTGSPVEIVTLESIDKHVGLSAGSRDKVFNSDAKSTSEVCNLNAGSGDNKAMDLSAASTEKVFYLDATSSHETIGSNIASIDKVADLNASCKAMESNTLGFIEINKSIEDETRHRSSSRCLKFDDLIRSNDYLENEISNLEDEVLGVSLVDDSYDVIKFDEVKESMNSTMDKTKEEISNTVNAGNEVLSFEAGKKSGSDDILFNAAKKHRVSGNEDELNTGLKERSGVLQSEDSNVVVCTEGNKNIATNNSVDLPNSDIKQHEETDANETIINEIERTGDVNYILNIDSNDSDSKTRQNNAATSCGAAAKEFSSLLSQTIESNDYVPALQNIGLKEQMKATTRRRSLVRRNTSPYFTSSLPNSLSPGPNFRMPKEATISETEDGSVLIDASTFRNCQNETKMIKTNLLRLKRILQEADVMSPFIKHAHKMNSSPPNTPSRPCLISRSFSDASSWLMKANRSNESCSFGSSQHIPRKNVISSNKTDQEKMEDEINNMKEKNKCLELEIEDLQHDLECKSYTIKLLQTQLENQEFTEQIELLTEEKIILSEENQALREKLEQLENQKNTGSSTESSSMKEQFLEISGSAKKLRAGMLQRYYEQNND